jgi:hypothetical protein
MTAVAPRVDARTADDVSAQIENLLKVYVKDEQGHSALADPVSGDLVPDPFRDALIAIAGRFAEVVIHRLNLVPQKHFIAFLDLLGATQLPPQAARVPLTFSLAAGSTVPGVVPAGTQVAAAPVEDEPAPTIFETEREFVVVPAKLTTAFARDPEKDQFADASALLAGASREGTALFTTDTPLEHVLYVGLRSLLAFSGLTSVTFDVTLKDDRIDPRHTKWEYWSGTDWTSVRAVQDGTDNLRTRGTITIDVPSPVPLNTIGLNASQRIESRWVRCTLVTPVKDSTAAVTDAIRPAELPTVKTIDVKATAHASGLPITAAFANAVAIDVSRDFFPFAQAPAFGDTWYVRCDEVFSIRGATVTLHVTLTNPVESDSKNPPHTDPSGKPVLTWEIWNGAGWVTLGTSTVDGSSPAGASTFVDATKALITNTDAAKKATDTVTFTVPAAPAPPAPDRPLAVNGIEGYWLRVRISGGNYGLPATYTADNKINPPTFAPPVIKGVAVDYTRNITASPADVTLLTYNDFTFSVASRSDSFDPFSQTSDVAPTVYFGFELIAGLDAFPNRPLSMFARIAAVDYSASASPLSATLKPPRLVWEYWNGTAWQGIGVRDDTRNFSRSGIIELLAPRDVTARPDFGVGMRYWIRVRWQDGDFDVEPRLLRLLLNTTMASQMTTVRDEILGSSDGSNRQSFSVTRPPVLPGQSLEVREPELPSEAERDTLNQEEGPNAIRPSADGSDQKDVWVRWHEVPDFYASGPRSRHYVVDRLAGRVLLGDGENGLVPPIGVNNLRLAQYQTGGGSAGNRPPGTIVQLKTTVPYVDKVTNVEPASGGADAEPLDSVGDRVPREIRHGGRAVTVEDYEDLALEASPEVARAKCMAPSKVPQDAANVDESPGDITLIIVPRSSDASPLPSVELIRRVQDFLDVRRTPTAHLTVVGPAYVEIAVTAEIVPSSLDVATRVVADVQERVVAFLHPLTGGFEGHGWDFGRQPHKSDLYGLIEAVEGVDHVRTLTVVPVGSPDALATGRFLVYSGTPAITVMFEGS